MVLLKLYFLNSPPTLDSSILFKECNLTHNWNNNVKVNNWDYFGNPNFISVLRSFIIGMFIIDIHIWYLFVYLYTYHIINKTYMTMYNKSCLLKFLLCIWIVYIEYSFVVFLLLKFWIVEKSIWVETPSLFNLALLKCWYFKI